MGKIRPKRALAVEQVRSIPEDMVFKLAAEGGPSDDERQERMHVMHMYCSMVCTLSTEFLRTRSRLEPAIRRTRPKNA